MRNGTPFVDYEPDSYAEVFSIINSRQITALMFHDQMADYFNFLGLDGFKEMHEYQYLDESNNRRKLKKYYISHHNKLIEEWSVSNPKAIPDDWLKYSRMDVNVQIRTQAIQTAMKKYQEWEEETKFLYSKCAKRLGELGCIADKCLIETVVSEVDQELKCLYKVILKLKSTNFDASFIVEYQDKLREKYKDKIKHLFD